MFKKIFNFLGNKEKSKFFILILFLIIGLFVEAFGLGIIVPMVSFFFGDNLTNYKSELSNIFPQITEYSNQEILILFISVLLTVFILRSFSHSHNIP